MGVPELIYCANGNPAYAAIAIELGWKYGAQLPGHVSAPLWFADQDWKNPDRDQYIECLRKHKPKVATVLDWEKESQFLEVLGWAEEAAQHVERLVIIPKIPGLIDLVPEGIGGKPVILGYSVPTSYGSTPCGLWEFGRRPVHLLGGSPQSQREIARYLNVHSVDGNMSAQQSRKGRFWSRQKGPKGHWWQLRDAGDRRTSDIHIVCFRRSLQNIMEAWNQT